jgi:protein tyrosine/serine phosphatase
LEVWGNFHPITPGEAYRSAELDRDDLEYYIRKYNIKSILNLQGHRTGDHHYRDEVAVCRELDLAHFVLSLSAGTKPSAELVDELLNIFEVAPRPILIHCKFGADRTGLAAAMWKVIVDGEEKRLASRQLSIRYFHLPFGAATAMDESFQEWEPNRKVQRVEEGVTQVKK